MKDVLGSNSINSQVLFTDFILMIFSLLSIVSSMINTEINYDQLPEASKLTGFNKTLNLMTLLFSTFSTVVIMINVYFRYKMQIKFGAYTHYLTHQDTLLTSGYYMSILYEYLMVILHPNLLLDGLSFSYRITSSDGAGYITITYNDIFLALMMFRVYYIIKYFVTLSYYQSSRAARTCRLYGEENGYFFSIRCLFNRDPFFFVVIMFSGCIIYFTITIRIFERAFGSPTRNTNYDSSVPTLADVGNSIWCVIITILTVGYGDFYARTIYGRLYSILGVIMGLLMVSLITVGFFRNLELDSAQNKVYILLQRMQLRQKHNELQKKIVEIMMYNHYTKFKCRKIREFLEGNDDILTEEEKNVYLREIQTWERYKYKSEIKMKHLIRDKNNVAK